MDMKVLSWAIQEKLSSHPMDYAIQVQSINLVPVFWPGTKRQCGGGAAVDGARVYLSPVKNQLLLGFFNLLKLYWNFELSKGITKSIKVVFVKFGSRQNLNECRLSCVYLCLLNPSSRVIIIIITRSWMTDLAAMRIVVCMGTATNTAVHLNRTHATQRWRVMEIGR